MTSEAFAQRLAAVALEKKANDISLLDMQGLVSYTDVLVICSASNPRQVRAICESVRQMVKREYGKLPLGMEGLSQGQWCLLDYGDVVIHVFHEPMRSFYDLESLWMDAPRLSLDTGTSPPLRPVP